MKPYHEMTPEERVALRIAQNKQIENSIAVKTASAEKRKAERRRQQRQSTRTANAFADLLDSVDPETRRGLVNTVLVSIRRMGTR